MRKIIVSFDDLFNEDFYKISKYADKTMEFYLLGDKNVSIPVNFIPALQSFPSKIYFVYDMSSSMTRYILLGFLCGKAGKNDEVCIIGDSDYPEPFVSIIDGWGSQPFSEVKCTVKKTLMELLMERKKASRVQVKNKNTGAADTRTGNKSEMLTEDGARKKPVPETQKRDTRETEDYNMRLLAKLKEIDKSYPFEKHINNIAAAVLNSEGKLAFEIQLQINCGKDIVSKLYPMLAPYLEDLKKV